MTDNEMLIYAAGLFDGEGSVGIRKKPPQSKSTTSPLPRYRLEVQVRMKHEVPLSLFQSRWGGSLRFRLAEKANWCNTYHWQIQSVSAQSFLADILPYLIIKKPQAEVAIAFQDHLKEYGRLRYKGQGLKRLPLDEMIRIREDFFERMKLLNIRGVKVQD